MTELSTSEWLQIRDDFEVVYDFPNVLNRIVEKRFGLSHNLNRMVNRLRQINRNFKNHFDQIICNAYPMDVEELPGTDIPIHAVFYQYSNMRSIPDIHDSFIIKLPKTFTPDQQQLLKDMMNVLEANLNAIVDTFNNKVSYKSPYYSYKQTVNKINRLRGQVNSELVKLKFLLD